MGEGTKSRIWGQSSRMDWENSGGGNIFEHEPISTSVTMYKLNQRERPRILGTVMMGRGRGHSDLQIQGGRGLMGGGLKIQGREDPERPYDSEQFRDRLIDHTLISIYEM